MTDVAATDPDRLARFAVHVWGFRQAEMVAMMIHLGDRLGLYRTLAGSGWVTAEELAERTGMDPRWLREWLRSQAAAHLLESPDGDRFRLGVEEALVLAEEEESLYFAAGAFGGGFHPDVVDGLAEAFRTGRGIPYDAHGPAGAHQTERTLGPWTRQMLVPVLLERIAGLPDRLREGARVADVGCGAGLALATLAEAFPASTFVGLDVSRHALDLAEGKIAARGLRNVELRHDDGAAVGGLGPFDLVLTFDCLHDMPHPERTVAAIGEALAPEGVWLVKEVRTSGDFATDRKNPMLAMMYATSVITCLASATSEPGGPALGTLGMPEARLREYASAAGFGRFATHDIGDPANLYFEIRR